jgi:serine kinase of HPr protein (carbohydrate metabolism regulator)
METVHATCIAFDGKAILLRGPPGSGKSDLAIRALAAGARLIADDQVMLASAGNEILASAPAALRGMIEVRGIGVMRMDADAEGRVALIADLADTRSVAAEPLERMPERRNCALMGLTLPWIKLAPFEASAVAKLRLALDVATSPDRLVS